MNKSMKQMLSMLLVVAMMAAMLVIPGTAANTAAAGVYKLDADAVNVKVGESTTVTGKVVYAVGNDAYTVYGVGKDATYVLAADTYSVEADAAIAKVDANYTVKADATGITVTAKVTGVKAGKTDLKVTVGGKTMTVPVTVEAKAPAVKLTGKYTFDATKIAAAGNAAATNDMVKAATTVETKDAKPVDGMFTVEGIVTVKASKDGSIIGVELAKEEKGKVVFTIPEGNKATVTVNAMSTGGSNESAYAMKKDGVVVPNDGALVSVVKGNTATTIVYTDLGAGTYEIVSPTDAERSRGMRIVSVEVDFGGAPVKPTESPKPSTQPSTQPSPSTKPSETPEMTVYTVKPDASKVTVRVNATKTVKVTTEPADGEVYVVSADATVTATVAKNVLTVKGVKAGKATVTLGVKGGKGTADVAVTVSSGNSLSTGGGAGGSNTNKPAPAPMAFVDVKEGDWFYDFVKKAFEKGLMNGTSETTFAPGADTTRAMVVTILARLDGQDTTGGDTWYSKAAEWAVKEGVSDGTNMESNVTREQLVTMLYRYAGSPKVSAADLSDFSDADAISDWAADAMNWAVKNGIILGRGNGTLDPKGVASRAEVCTMLVRLEEK